MSKRTSRRKRKAPAYRRRKQPSPILHDSGEHVIPTPLLARLLPGFTLPDPEHEQRRIREYVEVQARDERVLHLEKVKTERIRSRALDVWDVHTTGDRYWVITNPTNLYSQEHFSSLDFTLSFHVGVTERVFARQAPSVPTEEGRKRASAWRTWQQAAETLDHADEAEEFQAIGVRCRDALLDFIAATATPEMVPLGQEPPKRADFPNWTEHLANTIAAGQSAEHVRQYLKTIAKEAWQLVSWLTHAQNATWADAQLDRQRHGACPHGIRCGRTTSRNRSPGALPSLLLLSTHRRLPLRHRRGSSAMRNVQLDHAPLT